MTYATDYPGIIHKYRAWNCLDKEMIDWRRITDSPKLLYSIFVIDRFAHAYDQVWTLLQFTNKLDRNGKEIYQGDIFILDDPNTRYVVGWNPIQAGWTLGAHPENTHLTHTVIGNVFESPAEI